MAIKTLDDLFLHLLSDVYSAEKQMTKSLPRLAKAVEDPDLAAAFQAHLEETQGQVERLEQVAQVLDLKLKRIKCEAMEGLIEEAKGIIESVAAGPVRDAALIGGAQQVEHYEIASYGTLCALARQLGHDDAVDLLEVSLDEEKATDVKLTEMAQGGTNQEAAAA